MRNSALFLLPGVVFLASLAPAQNLVTNGDFSNGTSGWTFSGYAVKPGLITYNTSGTARSTSYSCRPGSKKGTLPPGGKYFMEQKVQLTQSLPFFLTADVAITNTLPLTNIDAGTFEFYVDQVLVARAKYKAIRPNQTLRRMVCARFTPKTSGSKVLKISFARDWGAQLGTPRHHIDNIALYRLPLAPLICPRLERKIGGTLTLDVYGKPSSPFVVFVSGSTIPAVKIPGFFGAWSIGVPPQSAVILIGAFDAAGAYRVAFPLPPALVGLAGVPLHWQGIEVWKSRLTIGMRADFGIYK